MTRLYDGFPTTLDLLVGDSGDTAEATLFWWEKAVTPPGVIGGGANNTTTMRNTRWRTKRGKKLVELGDISQTAAYDPELYDMILDIIQVNRRWRVNFADGSTLVFWGFLDEFVPNEIDVEGGQPDADIMIIPSNEDNQDPPVEQEPVWTAPS